MAKKDKGTAGAPTNQKPAIKKRTTKGTKKTLSLYERIFNVQAGLGTVVKSATHAHNKYEYATERDFIAETKPLLKRERLLILPHTKSHTKVEKQHTVEVEFTIINVDNTTERTEPITFFGSGDDKEGSVVGLPIAYTMALKYFLAKTFIAETGTDAEGQSDEGKKGKDSKPAGETPEQATETIKRMLAGSRNLDGIREYLTNRLPKITKLNAVQKKEIKEAAEKRIKELEAEEHNQDGGQATLV